MVNPNGVEGTSSPPRLPSDNAPPPWGSLGQGEGFSPIPEGEPMKALLTSMFAGLLLSGCSSEPQERPMADDPTGVAVALDPVSGAEVRTDSPWWTSYNGVRYYF